MKSSPPSSALEAFEQQAPTPRVTRCCGQRATPLEKQAVSMSGAALYRMRCEKCGSVWRVQRSYWQRVQAKIGLESDGLDYKTLKRERREREQLESAS